MKKRIITILLTFVITLSFMPMLNGNVYALEDTGNATFNAFINDGRFTNGVSWGDGQRPKLSSFNSLACCAYCADFTKYCFGIDNPRGGTAFSNASDTRAGDVVYLNGHWIAVLKRSGNNLFVAEGNASSKVRIGWGNYSVSGSLINGCTISGWHFGTPGGSDTSHNPIGAFDVVEDKCGAIFVRGWAFDPDNKGAQIEVHVYIGADSTAGGGEAHAIKANTYRNDVNNVYGCGDYHGFDAVINTQKTGNQTVYVFGINTGEGGNQLIGTKNVNISNPNPVGNVDTLEGKEGSIHVTGWVFDPNDISKSLDVHVYIGGDSFASGGEAHVIKADKKRADVDNAYKCGAYHGFDEIIETCKTGNQAVYVYGINIGSGGNQCIKSKTVKITKHTHSLTKVPSKAATTSSEGNIEYWVCSGCEKIFKDSAGKTEISKADTVIAKLTPASPTTNTGTNNPAVIPEATEIIDLPAVSISNAKGAKKAATVKWKKVSKKNQKKIAKVQIQYSTDKTFTTDVKSVLVKKTATSKKIKKLASKKQYYFRVRAYKKVGAVDHVSKWSKVKKAKIK